jgi:hypothetical protein
MRDNLAQAWAHIDGQDEHVNVVAKDVADLITYDAVRGRLRTLQVHPTFLARRKVFKVHMLNRDRAAYADEGTPTQRTCTSNRLVVPTIHAVVKRYDGKWDFTRNTVQEAVRGQYFHFPKDMSRSQRYAAAGPALLERFAERRAEMLDGYLYLGLVEELSTVSDARFKRDLDANTLRTISHCSGELANQILTYRQDEDKFVWYSKYIGYLSYPGDYEGVEQAFELERISREDTAEFDKHVTGLVQMLGRDEKYIREQLTYQNAFFAAVRDRISELLQVRNESKAVAQEAAVAASDEFLLAA